MLHLVHVNDTESTGVDRALAQVATAIRRLRREDHCDVLVHAGDVRLGGAAGAYTARLLRALGFDGIAIGNHDLDSGVNSLRQQALAAQIPLLCANGGGALAGFPPYRTLRRRGLRIALAGLTRGATAGSPPGDVLPPEVTLRTLVPRLRRRADLVVVVSHLGLDPDTSLAETVPGIDVIVSGHCHTLVREPRRVGHTWIVEAGAEGHYVGWLALDVSVDGNRGATGGILPTADLPLDRYALKLIAEEEAEGAEIVGYTAVDLFPRSPDDPGESPLANLHADLMLAHAKADVALLPWRLFAGSLPVGPIRRVHLRRLTSSGQIARMHLSGAQLRAWLEGGTREAYRLLLTAGARVVYDAAQPEGQRIRSIVIGDPPVPLDPARRYTIACTATMASLMAQQQGVAIETLPATFEELLLEYLFRHGPLTIQPDGRLVIHGHLRYSPPFRSPKP